MESGARQIPGNRSWNVTEPIDGTPTTEPTFGLPAVWITKENRERAQMMNYTVVDPATVLATHLTETIRSHAYELLGRQEVKALMDYVGETHPKLIEELVPKTLSVGEIQKVLQNLLREKVSIRDLITIFETLADYGSQTKDHITLTEVTRGALNRSITKALVNEQGELASNNTRTEMGRETESVGRTRRCRNLSGSRCRHLRATRQNADGSLSEDNGITVDAPLLQRAAFPYAQADRAIPATAGCRFSE